MGHASRSKKTASQPGLAPNAQRVKCEELEYYKLRLAMRDADVIIAECQAKVNAVVAVRDAAIKMVTDRHGIALKPDTRIQWDDDGCELAFS